MLPDENDDTPRVQSYDDVSYNAPCRRKEFRTLTADERNLFSRALNDLKDSGVYNDIVKVHRKENSPSAHFGPAFYGWHRCYMMLLVSIMDRCNYEMCIILRRLS